MADSERFKTGGDEAGDPTQRREELDQLLQRIAAHIAEVDKSAGDHARAPEEGDTPHAASAPSATGTDADAKEEAIRPADSVDVSGGEARPSRLARRALSQGEAPALRSALRNNPTESARHHDVPGMPGRPADEDGKGPESPETHAGESPWDSEAAEALTRTYEADAAVPPLRSMLHIMAQQGVSGGQNEARGGGRSGSMLHGEISHADVDAAQTRLFEAARRVEAMLDGLASREAVDALGDRFQSLESEVRRSGDQLSRLDGIEHRLSELGEKLTDQQVLNLFGSIVPTADDLTQFAEDAAGRAAERVLEAYARDISPAIGPHETSKGESSSAMSSQLASLGELLGTYMDERRRNEASTLEALETLQLAMQHVLDRVDRSEVREEPQASPIGSGAMAHHDMPVERATAASPSIFGTQHDHFLPAEAALPQADDAPEGMINLTANQVTGAPDLTAESYSMPASGMHGLARTLDAEGESDRQPDMYRPADVSSEWPHETEGVYGVPDAPAAPSVVPAESRAAQTSEVQPPSDRQAFIANARKAAERASAQAGQPAKAKGEDAVPRKAKAARSGIFGAAASTGVIRPGVLLVAIAAILFAGYLLLFSQRHGLLRSFVSVAGEQTQSQAAPAASAVGSEADVGSRAPTDSVPPASEPAGRPSPSNTSGEPLKTVPSTDQQEASAAPAANEAAGPGMTVSFGNSSATYESMMKARERNRLASLSQRAAFSAVQSHSAIETATSAPIAPRAQPVAQPRQTSAIETASVPGNVALASRAVVGTGGQDAQQLSLPPATIGPLSLRLAAAKGDAAAQLEVATRLAEGKGVRQNFAEAARWYEHAANQGNAIAQYRLATLHERGMGVKADRKKAQALYESAAQQGNLKAMHNLAVIIAGPATGAPDYIAAARLFSRAAQHGLQDSQYNLGVLYENGLGVPKDHGAAYKWYSLAARSGDTVAARRRDTLISRLPAETIQAMDAQIATWQAAPADEAANNPRALKQQT